MTSFLSDKVYISRRRKQSGEAVAGSIDLLAAESMRLIWSSPAPSPDQHGANRVRQPLGGSGGDRATPDRPRATRRVTNAAQLAPSSALMTSPPEDLPVALGTHARGYDSRHRDDASALSHPVEQGVEPDVGIGAPCPRRVAELCHLDVEVLGELGSDRTGGPVTWTCRRSPSISRGRRAPGVETPST